MTQKDETIGPLNASKTLIMVTYYGFKDPISHAAHSLAFDHDYLIYSFPLFKWKHDQFDRVDRYMDIMNEMITRVNPDALVFWYYGITRAELESLQLTVPLFLFNWSDPYCWKNNDTCISEIAPLIKGVLTCSNNSIPFYQELNNDVITIAQGPGYHLPLASNVTSKYNGPDRFVCDVMFACTALYDCDELYGDQQIKRRDLIDALYNDSSIVLHLYGPPRLGQLYPRCYKKYLSYSELYPVIRTAKVCINTHVISKNINHYINERTSLVLGCGGLLITDVVLPWENCSIYMGSTVESAMSCIKNTLSKPYQEMETLRECAIQVAKDHLTWSSWGISMNQLLMKFLTLEPKKREMRERVTKNNRNDSVIVSTNDNSFVSLLQFGGNEKRDQENNTLLHKFMQNPGGITRKEKYHLWDCFDRIQSSKNQEDFEINMKTLINCMTQSPTMNIQSLLSKYFQEEDSFH